MLPGWIVNAVRLRGPAAGGGEAVEASGGW